MTMTYERHYWLHRISNSKEVSYPLLREHGLLSYGWSDVGEKKRPNDFRNSEGCFKKENFGDAFEDVYGKKYLDWRGRWFLWNFVCRMSAGDYVLVPVSGAFHVYELADDESFAVCDFPDDVLAHLMDWNGNAVARTPEGKLCPKDKQQIEHAYDLGFFRKVKTVVCDVPRGEYANAKLTSRLKYRGSNVNCDDLKLSIKNVIESFESKKPINLHSLILDAHQENFLHVVKDNLNPRKFEKIIAWYFRKLGAKTDIPPRNQPDKKGDADVLATFDQLKVLVCVQAKFHDEKTGAWGAKQVQEYAVHIDEKNRAKHDPNQVGGIVDEDDESDTILTWLISTADDFTDACKREADKCNVRLVTGKMFAKMLLEVGISDLDDFENL